MTRGKGCFQSPKGKKRGEKTKRAQEPVPVKKIKIQIAVKWQIGKLKKSSEGLINHRGVGEKKLPRGACLWGGAGQRLDGRRERGVKKKKKKKG